jgi:putative Ca2+/H+ antiporter (TMEM165/GDT1 family)
MLAAKISEKTVAVIGGSLFLFFGVTSFLFGPEEV